VCVSHHFSLQQYLGSFRVVFFSCVFKLLEECLRMPAADGVLGK
jgi:hypothetical protein